MAGYFAAQEATPLTIEAVQARRATARICLWHSTFRWELAAATMRCCSASRALSKETMIPPRLFSPRITCRFCQKPTPCPIGTALNPVRNPYDRTASGEQKSRRHLDQAMLSRLLERLFWRSI
jgi:hypothetical protein